MTTAACPYGTHRVISPKNGLPQNAQEVDNSLPIRDNEILIEVDTLNVDAASFRQMSDACNGDVEGIKQTILKTVSERGKQHNPVTGSGGMLLGTVKEIGANYSNKFDVKVGDKIATLVSLSLTPLRLEKIIEVFPGRDQVKVEGYAILFDTGVLAKIPADMPEALVLAILDVAGAPAQAKRLVKPNQTVVIIGGGGKSGVICAAVARDILGTTGKLIGLQPSDRGVKRMNEIGYFDHVLQVDAREAVACAKAVSEVTDGEMADLVINCVSVDNCELSSVMCAKPTCDATVYFFSMATSFTKAALGAEGIGSDALMIVGNGFVPDHANISLDVIRKHPELRELFEAVYV
ncbi:L-erythro-3,5-diaminohexanoate dehydrogenase [bacterium]|nr:L-erythro-3,5-diaminohexanoate dehydrogenase [bacterium]MBU1918954.1 L-erythro-3,5-diaminohexanoate dehydrogenase [bacterium]